MTIEQSAVFLASTILTGLGLVVVGIVVVALNNLFAKYWQPINWIPEAMRMPPPRFIDTIEPGFNKETK